MTYSAQELTTRIQHQHQHQHPTYGQGNLSEQTVTWSTYAEAFCRFEPLLGREFFAAQQHVSEAQAKITMRWRGDISAYDRIIARDEKRDIVSVQNIAYRNQELLIYIKRNPIANS